jgi:hypothetical protein
MDRRSVLGLIGAASVATLAGRRAVAAPLALDPKNKRDAAFIFRKVLYSLDDRLIFWWMDIMRYAQTDNALQPQWRLLTGSIAQVMPGPDAATYSVKSLAIPFYLDLETNRILEKYENPITGETVIPRTFGSGGPPSVTTFTIDGADEGPPRTGIVSAERSEPIGPIIVQGDECWVRADSVAKIMFEGERKVFNVSDMSEYHARWSDVTNPDIQSAPARKYFVDVLSWQRFLNMHEQPGGNVGRGPGGKVFSFEDMPEDWKKLVADRAPKIAKDPRSALEG